MSQPDLTSSTQTGSAGGPGVFVQKPKSDIYTVLLGISLAAILMAILCLGLELRANSQDRTGAVAPSSAYALRANALAFDVAPISSQTRPHAAERGTA